MEDIMKTESKKSDSQKPSDHASPATKITNGLEIEVEENNEAQPARVTGRSYIGDNNFAFGQVKESSDPQLVIDGYQSYLRKRNETKSALLHDSDMSQITGMI